MTKYKATNKTRAHVRYRLKDRTIVPGVTTITGQIGWGKEALIKWANNLGLKGIDSNKYTDDKADIGVLAHQFITDGLQGLETDTGDFTKNQIDESENSVLSFYEWQKEHPIEPILIEAELVSEEFKFGGKADIYGKVNGRHELIDLKTGSGIYDEHIIQVAGGYRQLLIENGYPVDRVRILNIPRSEDERFIEELIGDKACEVSWQIFKSCLDIYYAKKQLKLK